MAHALGRYELLRPLARGGMAEVFLARRRSGGVEKILVIKRIRSERAGDPRFLELFLREARLSMGLTHQNIVPVFDFGRVGEQVFLAMERVEGADLAACLARAPRPPPPLVAAFIAAECCGALAYAHARTGADGAPLGIVHRDVTPRNVLVSWSGEVKLTDFGVAGLAGDDGGRTIGTPAYMAPEQARGEPADARADLYAIGLVLRELVTGARARPGDDRAALLDAARTGALPPWPADDAIAAELRAIVERATAPAVGDRFADATTMAAALDDLMVAARARERGEAPARQLAAWMEEIWRGARPPGVDDAGADAGLAAADDLGDGAIGTGTERSLAETDAEVAEAPPAPPPALGPTSTAPPPPAAAPAHRRRRRAPAAIAAIALAAVGVTALGAGLRWSRPRDRTLAVTPTPAAPDGAADPSAVPAADAMMARAPSPTTAPPADANDANDAPAPPPTPGPLDGGLPGRRPPRPGPTATSPARGDDVVAAAPAPVRRRVRVNARPWAMFTVDDEGVEHETIATVELTPGPHRLHFRNPELGVTRVITIVVPVDRDLDHVEDLRR